MSLPEGDRLTQSRNQYYPNQQLLANKQLRWWWNNSHQAIYDDGDGTGWSPHGPYTEWNPQSKSITFAEYGFPACDRGTNQPNVFYAPDSVESFTPFWSIWDPSQSVPGSYWPRRDDELQLLALQAIYEYWVTDGNNETSSGGVPMIQPAFMSVWNWDARPFPDLSAADGRLGRHRQLARRQLARRQRAVSYAARARRSAGARPICAIPCRADAGLVGALFADLLHRRGAACLRPGGARGQIRLRRCGRSS